MELIQGILKFFCYLMGVIFSIAIALLPRKFLESELKKRMQGDFYPTCTSFLFCKSGRAALAAVFQGLAKAHPGAVVLVPDYICNVVDRAAAGCDVGLVRYRTDSHFHADFDDIEHKLNVHHAAALLLASLFGCQNRGRAGLDRIRALDRQLLLIIDDCQNLVTGMPFYPDDRTVVVFSFNMKNVLGVMGGGVCFAANPLSLRPPQRDFTRDAALEVLIFLRLMQQVKCVLLGCIFPLFRSDEQFVRPVLEFSDCCGLLYDTRMQRISRFSLVRAIHGLLFLNKTEARRRRNYMRLSALLEERNWGNPVCTETVHISPFVVIEGLHEELIGRLPFKGPYAKDENPASSFRPNLLAYRNDGLFPLEFNLSAVKINSKDIIK